MSWGGTVVRAQAWRRWGAVLAVVAVLCSVPIVLNAWPARAAPVEPAVLRERIAASADLAYQGYAQSSGLLPLPPLPNLEEVTDLLSTKTEMRVWYAARDRWRVDVIEGSTERDLYQTPGPQYVWDFGDNRLTEILGDQPVRLPRAADLTPPDLVRRILGIATGDRVEALAGKRVAGIRAAGLRIVPGTAPPTDGAGLGSGTDTTVDHIDVWADPATGLPVQAEVTARGGRRPVFVTRFLELDLTTPDPATITPPADRENIDFRVTEAPDVLGAINRRRPVFLPDELAGMPRRDAVGELSVAGVYGTGLAQIVVAELPGRFGGQAYDRVATFGKDVPVPVGVAAVIGTGLLSVLVVQSERTYLVAGLVQPAVLERVAADLAEAAA